MRISDWSSDVGSSDLCGAMTERHTAPHRSVAEFSAAEIAPGLPALETQRRGRRRNAYTRLLVAAFVVVVTALIVGMAWHALAGGAVLIVGEIGRASCRERVCQYV